MTRHAYRTGFQLGVICAIFFAAGCTGENKNVLHLYGSIDSQEIPAYTEKFEKETGITVKWVRLSAGEVLARLEAEKNNPQVAVWFGGPSPEYIIADQRGLLEPYKPNFDTENWKAHAKDWSWTGLYFGAIGFACNEKFLEQKGVKCPDSWEGLLDPAFKGQVAVAYPYTSGTSYMVVAAILKLYGEEKGWEFIRKLDGQIHHYNSSGSAAVTQVGLGEVAVGIAFSQDILKKGKAAGYPVVLSIPKEGTASEIGGIALVKGAKNQELGKKFIDWMVSEKGQTLLLNYYRVPLSPKVEASEGAVTASSVKLIGLDPQEAAKRQKEILDKWRKVTGR